jgi:hypothetical protein
VFLGLVDRILEVAAIGAGIIAGIARTAATAGVGAVARIINVAARLAHRARTVHRHPPERWPWRAAFDNLFTAVQAAPA